MVVAVCCWKSGTLGSWMLSCRTHNLPSPMSGTRPSCLPRAPTMPTTATSPSLRASAAPARVECTRSRRVGTRGTVAERLVACAMGKVRAATWWRTGSEEAAATASRQSLRIVPLALRISLVRCVSLRWPGPVPSAVGPFAHKRTCKDVGSDTLTAQRARLRRRSVQPTAASRRPRLRAGRRR